jgi:hypothetical protein
MRGTQPKKNLTIVNLKKKETNCNIIRKSYVQDIVHKAPIVPKPLEYADIDNAFKEFVENELGLTINGKDVPTFTLYSNQRFSEYSQTWKHSDEEGNLILNFKTINRNTSPQGGENQGGLWNIPGERFYTVLKRSVLDDNGTESMEVYSMKQPYAVTLEYRVSFITDLFENLTTFNEMVNDIFKARQYYIRPNNHYVPLLLESVEDESKYSVSDYRFYVQTVVIKALGYIIHEEDFKVEKFPKRIHIGFVGDKKNKVKIDIEEGDENELENQTIKLSLKFEKWHDKAVFEIDTDMDIQNIDRTNVRNMRIFVNDTPIYWEKGFKVKDGDRIRVKINQFDVKEEAMLIFNGINPNYSYQKDYVPEDVSAEPLKHQDIEIE